MFRRFAVGERRVKGRAARHGSRNGTGHATCMGVPDVMRISSSYVVGNSAWG